METSIPLKSLGPGLIADQIRIIHRNLETRVGEGRHQKTELPRIYGRIAIFDTGNFACSCR